MSEVSRIRQPGAVEADGVSAAAPPPAGRVHRVARVRRVVALVSVPVLVIAAGTFAYLHGGRYASTDNAYVKAHTVFVAAEVSGAIIDIPVEENDKVAAGTTLFRLDPAAFRIALQQADAALAQVATEIAADKLAYQRAVAEIELNETAAEFARKEHERQIGLRANNLASAHDLDAARYTLDSALQRMELSRREAARLRASLGGDPDQDPTLHPLYLEALAQREQAALDLARTTVVAPFTGVVTKRPDKGKYVELGRPVLSVVSSEGMWVEANFKETELTHIRPGQSAVVEVDTYPGEEWRGVVQSISEATGAEFALLPPQNATGNWVKIVQRVPVKIVLDERADGPPLRAGMSCDVTIDTHHVRTARDLLPW